MRPVKFTDPPGDPGSRRDRVKLYASALGIATIAAKVGFNVESLSACNLFPAWAIWAFRLGQEEGI